MRTRCEVVFVAVGQGDCIHLRAEDHDVLLDGGGQTEYGAKDTEGYNVGKNILMPYLMHAGADNVDLALVTHLHEDHYKGIAELAEIFPVGAIGIPADYRDSLDDLDLPAKGFLINPDTKADISKELEAARKTTGGISSSVFRSMRSV